MKVTKIRKRDGRIVLFDQNKITEAIWKAAQAVGGRDKKTAERLAKKVVKIVNKKFAKKTPSVEEVQDIVEKVLIESGHAKTAKAYILYRQRRTEIREEKKKVLEKEIIDEVDKQFDVNALKVLKSRYLRKDENGKLIETPKELFIRVATHIALPNLFYDTRVYDKNAKGNAHKEEQFDCAKYENKIKIGKYKLNRYHLEALKRIYDRFNRNKQIKISWQKFFELLKNGEFNKYEKDIDEFYNLMVSKRFLPNTPAIANFGNPLGMGSACFALDIEDSIESIMDALKKASIIFKAGGGVGYNFSKLRPEGDYVSTTHGVASGPLSFMRLFDVMTDVIKQGGCVATNTLVRTDKGIVPIGEMLNSRPLSENITNYFVFDGNDFNHACLAQNNGYAEVYRIKTELGAELKATFNHMVATINEYGRKEWKRVIDLKKGDWLVTVIGEHIGNEIKLPKLEKQHHNSNKLKIPEVLTTELAEILGLYVADGCTSNGRFLFSINSKDTKLYNRVKNLMKNVFGLELGEVRDKGTYKDIVFFSKDLEKYFEKLNWKKEKAPNCFVPASILTSKEDVVCAFLRGLFEGDGSVHPDGYPILYSSSKTLVEQVQQLLLSLGIISRLFHTPKEKLGNHKGGDMYHLFLLTERSIKMFKEKIGFVSKEKNEKLNNFKLKYIEYCDLIPNLKKLFTQYYKWVGRGSGPNRSKRGANLKYYKAVWHYLKGDRNLTRKNLKRLMQRFDFLNENKLLKELVNDRYFYTTVKDVEKQEDTYTMEIEVPASGCYIANGLLVHNIRRGANMGILNSNHPDIEKFIKAKEGNKALRNFNISILIMPDFWDYYNKNKPYPLINPRNKEVAKYVNPKMLFDLIVYQAWESAEPGIIFYDNINKHNPFLKSLGPIVTTNPCIISDAWIMTSFGPKQVKELIGKKTEVMVNGKKWLNAGNGFFYTGTKDVFKLKTEEGFELSLTGNHLIRIPKRVTRYTIDYDWKQAKDLESGDKVIINFHKDLEWEGKHDEKEGYLIGYLIGDGTISDNKVILESWGNNKGERKVRSLIERYVNFFPHRSDFKGWMYDPRKRKYRLIIAYLKELTNDLRVNKKKEITPEIEKTSSSFYKGFLKGIFDTDGSVQGNQKKGVSIRLSQSDLKRLKAVQRMLLRLGIFSKIYTNRRKAGSHKLPDGKGGYKFYKIKAQHELIISGGNILRFYERIGFENSDKTNKLREVLKKYKRKLNRERFLATVKEIAPIGIKDVYDIQVPGINAFDANGFYVHNCGELLLYPNESCNLGSINIWRFAKEDKRGKIYFDWELLKETVILATKFLDNVIDVNKYPIKEIEELTLETRKIGLGVMGLADLLFELEVSCNNKEGRKFMEKLMEFINYYSKIASIELAKQREVFPFFDKSFYPNKLPFAGFEDKKSWRFDWNKIIEDIKNFGIRNSITTVIAPTGSISMIAGCSSGIEPVYSLIFEKHVKVGSFYYIDPVFERAMRKEELYDEVFMSEVVENNGSIQNIRYVPPKLKRVFVTAHDISPEDHILTLALFQKWVDSSISKTNNFPANATVDDMRKSYLLAYKLGCKDVTVFRDTSIRGQVLVVPGNRNVRGREASTNTSESTIKYCPNCKRELIYKEGCLSCPECGWGVCV